ncbi:unnamed protein product [Brassicogethes aeneus]|uniref:C2H2-type domain-containing protein n=1 Tax=Brassicogethes aeneus TaxID=1431903 RepID=A0A9P0FDD7_BRAAE|nr:unnamed protein product [Brassicogethes aeneus]
MTVSVEVSIVELSDNKFQLPLIWRFHFEISKPLALVDGRDSGPGQKSTETDIETIKEIYKCKLCKFTSVDMDRYRIHLKMLHCPYCDVVKTGKHFETHVISKHRVQNNIEKKIQFSDKTIKRYLKLKKYVCMQCSYNTTCHKELVKHKKEHWEDLPCPYCEYTTKEKLAFQKHVCRMHKDQNEIEKKVEITVKMYTCHNCGYAHPELGHYKSHIKTCKKSKFECPECFYTTSNISELHTHIRDHNKQHLICTYCLSKAKCRRLIYGKAKFCPYCTYSTKSNSCIQMHVYNKHKQQNKVEKKFLITQKVVKCKFCSYNTINKSTLNSHEKICKEVQPDYILFQQNVEMCFKELLEPQHIFWASTLIAGLLNFEECSPILLESLLPALEGKSPTLCCEPYSELEKAMPRQKDNEPFMIWLFDESGNIHKKLNSDIEDSIRHCSYCPFTSKCQDTLNTHIKIHKIKSCPYCKYTNNSNVRLQWHVYSKHKRQNDSENKVIITAKILNCKFCLYSTLAKSNLNKHEKCCEKNPQSDEIGNKMKYIKRNIKRHSKFKWFCPYCKHSNIQWHTHSNQGSSNDAGSKFSGSLKVFKCNFCFSTTLSKSWLERHEKAQQSKMENDVKDSQDCPIVTSKKFPIKSKTKGENPRQTRMKKHTYRCEKCGYGVSKLKTYIAHIKRQCKEPQKIKTNVALQAHVFSKHRGLNDIEKKVEFTYKILNCSNCTYATMVTATYKKHVQTCLGPKIQPDIQCPYCKYQTKDRQAFQRHVFRLHNDQNEIEKKVNITIKIYHCPKCEYRQPDSGQFRKHVETCCSMDIMLLCPECLFSTEDQLEYITHIQSHSNDKELKCFYTNTIIKTEND